MDLWFRLVKKEITLRDHAFLSEILVNYQFTGLCYAVCPGHEISENSFIKICINTATLRTSKTMDRT
jgi:hypothetical protein